MIKDFNELLQDIRHTIIVSCQALPSEPLYCEEMSLMPFMAKAAQMAGCKCIRTSSVRDVAAIKEATGLPVIGLIKKVYDGYDSYITPTNLIVIHFFYFHVITSLLYKILYL